MPPKPFPYPIGVGVDICHIPRLYNIVGKPDDYITRWAKKIFTRLEWPQLWQKFHETNIQRSSYGATSAQLWLPGVTNSKDRRQRTHSASSIAEAFPSLHNRTLQHTVIRSHETQNLGISYGSQLGDVSVESRPLSLSSHAITHDVNLAQYLAGRWAAKEAAIKAHRNRKLSLNDISILYPEPSGIERSNSSTNQKKLHALIAPEITKMVVMTSPVAKIRGLLERQSRFPHVYGEVNGGQFVRRSEPNKHDMLTAETGKFWVRGLRIKDDERQIAEINISHDHDYAVAVCMALDEKASSEGPLDYIVDDGSGECIHEPEWGDEGWLGDTSRASSSGVDEHLFS